MFPEWKWFILGGLDCDRQISRQSAWYNFLLNLGITLYMPISFDLFAKLFHIFLLDRVRIFCFSVCDSE